GVEVDGLPRVIGRDTEAAEPEEAVAGGGAESFGVPQLCAATVCIEAAISGEWMACERKAGTGVAEAFFEQVAQASGPIVGGGVGVAVVEYVDGGGFRSGELGENRHERARLAEG